MNGRAVLVGVVVLLVFTALPATAVTSVGSINTTDSDFNNAATLSNVTVSGTGTAANVRLQGQLIDSFEDGGLTEYTGNTGDWGISTSDATDGSDHLVAVSNPPDGDITANEIISTSGLPTYYAKGSGNLTVDFKLNGSHEAAIWFGVNTQSEANILQVDSTAAGVRTNTSTGIFGSGSEFSVSLPTDKYVTADIRWNSDDTVDVTFRNATTDAVIDSFAGDNEFLNDNEEGSGIGFSSDEDGVQFDNARISDKVSKGTYIGQNHTVDYVTDGFANITLQNATATITWQGSNGNTWTDLETSTYSSTGNVSVGLPDTYSDYRANVTFVRQSGETTAKLHDEGVLSDAPGTLNVYNETQPDQLITDPVNITVFINNASEDVVSYDITDGTLDLANVPAGPSYIFEVRSDNFHARVRFIDSLSTNKSFYLLNTTQNSVETRFTLTDATGKFPSESVLFITRPINQSGTTQFEQLYSDRFGTEGVTLDMEQGVRYRLRIRSPDGTVQDLGPYRADVSETVELRPSDAAIQFDDVGQNWSVGAEIENDTLIYRYSDPSQETDSVTVWIYERGNKSNELRPNVTYYNVGNVSAQEPLTATESDKEWVVRYLIDRNGNEADTFVIVNERPDLLPTDIDREWRLIPAIILLLFAAASFSVLNRGVGAVVVGVLGGILWWTGWLTGATSAAAITLYLFIAVVYNLYTGD